MSCFLSILKLAKKKIGFIIFGLFELVKNKSMFLSFFKLAKKKSN